MTLNPLLPAACALLPALLMAAAVPHSREAAPAPVWQRLRGLTLLALLASLASLAMQLAAPAQVALLPGLAVTTTGAWMAVLVQLLGTVIAFFSARYLEGEPGQPRYIAALGGVLAAVQVLLLADHWVVLIAAWAVVGLALEQLLCFYRDRPFALLAAHKKRVADRLADVLLAAAAVLAWHELGTGSLSAMSQALQSGGTTLALQASAVCLALAVVLRTALLPVHGWLIQVMEAPTPVSALLHAGVINLGGFVLIKFAPLLQAAPVARGLLVGAGLLTAILAGLVMLTRISIKVRLAWSTVAQMGFMVMECGLGLYTLALLHLIGHSLYKAHAFLSASGVVEDTRLRLMRGSVMPSMASMLAAPLLSAAVIAGVMAAAAATVLPTPAWPWWWSMVLAFAWAPLLWLPAAHQADAPGALRSLGIGAVMVAGLVLAALVGHALPFGLTDAPQATAGLIALAGMAFLYLSLLRMQSGAPGLASWRRWSYAGFYVDEFVTRAALKLWPARWTAAH